MRFPGHRTSSLVLFASMIAAAGLHVAAQEPPGVVVEEIATDSVGARVGLKGGDRLVSYDGRPLTSTSALQAAEENAVKPSVSLRVQRDGEMLALTAAAGALGVQARPELAGVALDRYQEARAAQAARKPDDAAAHWTAAARAALESGATPA